MPRSFPVSSDQELICDAEVNNLLKKGEYFWKVKEELWTENKLVLKGNRIVIPAPMRQGVLKKLHVAHQGIERTLRRARQLVYWPGLTSDVKNMINSCDQCQMTLPSLGREPMMTDPPPSRVFEDVSVDIFSYSGNHYLVYADRLSGWPTIEAWYGRDLSARDVIRSITSNFVNLGVPVRIRCDNGPQFSSNDFIQFTNNWGVKLTPSTPYYPQSNGHAEAAVKAMKNLLRKTSPTGRLDNPAFLQGLLEWRNTPRKDGMSPAEIVFGHQLRSIIPAHHSSFAKKWREETHQREAKAENIKNKATKRYNEHAHPLQPIPIGATVRIQNPISKEWDKKGTIISIGQRRDYRIELSNGRIYWRNRRFIREIPASVNSFDRSQNAVPENIVPITTSPDFNQSKPPPRHRGKRDRPHEDDVPLRRSKRTRKSPSRYTSNYSNS